MDKNKAAFITILLSTGVVLIFLGQQLGQELPYDRRFQPMWFSAIGALFFILSLLIYQNQKLADWFSTRLEILGEKLGCRPWQILLLAASLPMAGLAPMAAGFASKMLSPIIALVCWILSIGLVLAGAYDYSKRLKKPGWRTLVWFTILLVFAFLVRGLATNRYPIILTGDEGSAGINATAFAQNKWNNIFITGWYSFPSLFFFVQSLSIRIFGQTIQALRIPSALAGALTVAATYVVGKKMFDQRTGLLAGFFMAAFHLHIHFSRIGLNNIWDGLWYVVVVGALWVGWEREQRNPYLIAGLGLGLAQYFYPSSRTLLGLVLGGIVLAAIFDRPRLRRALPHLGLMLLTALIVTLPLTVFYIKHPNDYLAPLRRVTIFGPWMQNQVTMTGHPAWLVLLQQIWIGFQAYTLTDLRAWYTPETPILRPIAASLFYLGLILMLLRNRDSRLALLLLWLSAFAVIGGLSESTPAAQRYPAAVPACALIVGYGLSQSIAILSDLWPKAKRIFAALAVVVLLVAMSSDLYFYFGDYTPKSLIDNTVSNGLIAQHLANYLQTQPNPDNTQVVFLGAPFMGYYSIPSVQYLNPNISGIDINQYWGSPENPPPSKNKRLIFVFLENHQNEIPLVRADYPYGELYTEKAWNNQVMYWYYVYTKGVK